VLIAAWHEFLAREARGRGSSHALPERTVRGRRTAEFRECHNSPAPPLTSSSRDGHPWQLISPTDVDGLEDHLTTAAQPFAQALTPPVEPVREMAFSSAQLGSLRQVLSGWASGHELGEQATEELVLAVNELATNSIRYGGGHGRLLSWCEGEALICEVRDAGHIQDPLIGRSRPAPNEHTGRGLWLVHQLCDRVQIHSVPSHTAVRVHKQRAHER
jgi:anti-sigma regulatory factor (Ser/Thr protein kinase)